MRVLLVEDKIDFAEVVEKAIRAIEGSELSWKRSKTGALAVLAEEHFDVVILDRRIPTEDDFLDDHQDHGWEVFQAITEQQPGTSVWFLTGTVDADFPTEVLNAHSKRGDIHSCGREDALYQVFWKDKMPKCVAALKEFRSEVQQTDNIQLLQVGTPVNLRAEEVRLLKLFGRRHQGARVEVRVLQGGLSGARVFRVSVFNAAGAVKIMTVARIGSFKDIATERQKYQIEIVKLAIGAFPPVTAEVSHGASGYAGIFYKVVGAEVRSLFDVLTADQGAAAAAADLLRKDQGTWHGARQFERVRVSAVRRALIGDVALQQHENIVSDLDLAAVENVEIDVARCVQHCDLHCGNILFDDNGRPMVIDYPDTGAAFASFDPVTLELSTIFHKDAPDRGGWPTEAQANQWLDIDAFCAGSPYEPFIRSCRTWAEGVAASQQEVLAVAYGYALRQLKYDDTDKTLVRAIVKSCIAGIVESGA